MHCDSGYQRRNRHCNNPALSFNGSYRDGESFEVFNCSLTKCPDEYKKFHLTKSTFKTSAKHQWFPYFYSLSDIALLVVDGHLGSWTAWTICNASCDSGYHSRRRHCNNQVPSFNGPYCDGEPLELLYCSRIQCPVDGNWGPWSSWTCCDFICGNGTSKRTRKCDNPLPASKGSLCTAYSNCSVIL
ncbi:HMCN [Mytilus coruscus]|uniref:HMCN n=1 Tax=Mytilus coruscus TaxID=42192 RepID=A0A6J8CLQ5_MYTCO|nr:HMCN [Mytilus coruscus]